MVSPSPANEAAEIPAADPPVLPSIAGLKGKRVAMVSFSEYPGDPRPRRAVTALLDEGMSVDFICVADGESPKREVFHGLRIRRLAIEHRRGGFLSYAYQYSAFILACAAILACRALRRRYDLVYIHNMPDVLVACALVPKLLGAKVILDQHDPMPELMTTIFNLKPGSLFVRVIKRLEKWSIARANLVITVNVACKRIFSGRSCPPEKIGIVMNAPDERIFRMKPAGSRAIGAPAKPFVIMYHGSIVERNGLDLAIDALAQVRQSVRDVELRIYGRKTAFLTQVMEAARNHGLQDCVHYLGPRKLEDLVREIDACDVGIIPNQRNAFTDINTPTRIFEYLALGKPVIAPRTLGIQDYFGMDSLLFFESGDAKGLAQKIEYVYAHSREAVEIARRGQGVFLEHAWPQERQTLLALVGRLLNRETSN